MTMNPGFDVELRETPVPRDAPTNTSTWFAVGVAEKGRTDAPTLHLNPDDVVRAHGARLSTSYFMDAWETYFMEGGSRGYSVRVVGPAAVKASVTLDDAAAADTLKVDAIAEGEWYNNLRAAIVAAAAPNAATHRVLVISHLTDGELERSPEFSDKADAVLWSASAKYVRVTSLAGILPAVVAATALTGGTSDIAGITDAQYDAAIARFSLLLGPGQVSMPGRTTTAAHTSLLTHASLHNRRAVLDAPNDPNKAVLIAAAAAQRSLTVSRFGAMFGPWDVIPGIFPNTTRVAPPSARVSGTIARSDTSSGNPNLPAAGDNGRAQFAIDCVHKFTDADYTELNLAGVNMSRHVFGDDLQVYGFRTLVNPALDKRWREFSGSRTVMYATAQARRVMAGFAFDQIDGQGLKFGELEGAITGVLIPLYEKGALFGGTPGEAFRVNASAAINTPVRIADGELRVVMALKTSPFAEHVVAEIVRRMVGEEV